MAFRDTIDYVRKNFICNPAYFAEQLTYTPFGLPSRTVYAHVEAEEDLNLEQDTETVTKRIRVRCLRDKNAVDKNGLAISGIDRPNIGDEIVRDLTIDEDQEPYLFNGAIERETKESWVLVFERRRRDAEGFSQL